jgi:hypothetical protein
MAAAQGNQYSAKGKEWAQSLQRAMARRAEGDFRVTLAEIADVVVGKALDGDKDAWREIADRMDGKTAQAVTVGGDAENPIQAHIIVEYVKAAGGVPVPSAE